MAGINPAKRTVLIPVNNYNNTRIAPTPSGLLHIGNILSFAITSALAKKSGAAVLLRIDDLDHERTNNGYLQDIFDTLNYLEIPWDKGPRNVAELEKSWSQILRIDLYHTAIKELCNKGLVFACTCSRQQILTLAPCTCIKKQFPLDTENASLRLITGTSELNVRNHNGKLTRAGLPADMKNFIITRKDGIPSYQLASVVDDLFFNIDLVIRGADLWPSTLAQHELALNLGESRFGEIRFYHHPLLMEASGKKLSKSTGATSIKYLRQIGKKPTDIYTLVAGMLGIEQQLSNWEQLADVLTLS